MDEADKKPVASLGDGSEVTVLAWRPGWSGGTRYRVRATDSGFDGWLPVGNLRSTKDALSPTPTASPPPAQVRVDEFREASKFGQRR